jgi:photosystem II stability/assembly factor-like uncharacterized protein
LLEFNTGFANRNFTAVASAGGVIYAATVYEPGSGGIFRSSNHGLSWQRVAGPGGGENVLNLAVAQDDPRVLFAAGYHGLFRSADGGDTWTKPASPSRAAIVTALLAPAHDSVLVGTSAGLFRFSAGIWKALAPPAAGPSMENRPAIEQLQQSAGGLLAALTATGAFRSDDDGEHWSVCGQPAPNAVWYGLAFDPAQNGAGLAATSAGLFRTTDRCATWSLVSGGLEAATASTVVYRPEHKGEAFTAQSGRVFHSSDGGVSWFRLIEDSNCDYPSSLFFLTDSPYRLYTLFPQRGILSTGIAK